MDNVDPSSRILEYAISKEVESYHFYMAMSRRVDTDNMREVFEELAAEELGHKARLELEVIKSGKVMTAQEESEPGPDSNYILSEDDALLDLDYMDMLLLAMEKEEASFRTYVTLVAKTRGEQSRELLLALAEEEVKHKLRFQTEYDILAK